MHASEPPPNSESTLAAFPSAGINYERLYSYRFHDVDQAGRQAVWREIARYAHGRMGAPQRILDPAAGRGEFITAVPAAERWGVDLFGQGVPESAGVKMILSDIMDAALPADYFRYCVREYFDCADHTVILTHVAVAEHLHSAGFEVTGVVPRFLPYSFRDLLPPSPLLTRIYLRTPALWPLLGKQFLVLARK